LLIVDRAKSYLGVLEMSVEVFKFEIKSVTDASEFERYILEKRIDADEVVAIIGKTEGNGGVNDFTRILSDQASRPVRCPLGRLRMGFLLASKSSHCGSANLAFSDWPS
jgi:hypothetical protein